VIAWAVAGGGAKWAFATQWHS